MKIYTYLRGQKEKEFVGKAWYEVMNLGWSFVGMKGTTNIVFMTRDGYINEFWAEEDDDLKEVQG